MEWWPHIAEVRERLARIEARIEQTTAPHSKPLLDRIGANLLSRNLVLAILLIWALATGRDSVAIKLLDVMI